MKNNWIDKVLKPTSWIIALNAIMVLLLFFKYIDYRYEYAVYRSLVTSNLDRKSETKTFKNLLSLTFKIQSDRRGYINDMYGMNPFKSRWFRSGDIQLLDATGACGNFSHVLAELCQVAGFEVRMVQLYYQGHFGGHNIVEAKVDGKWVAADGLFKTFWVNPDSSLASLEEIRENPKLYSNQWPKGYPYQNAFTNFHYTNWDKIPVIMPALHEILCLILGEDKADKISIRIYLLNLHKAQFVFLLLVYFPIFIVSLRYLYFFIKSSIQKA